MDSCLICGAPQEPALSNCKFCGTAYREGKVCGQTYIDALNTLLLRIDNEASQTSSSQILTGMGFSQANTGKKVSAISTFTMPSDVGSLVQFFTFCHGNAQVQVQFLGNYNRNSELAIKSAWEGKARAAYAQLKIQCGQNPELQSTIREFEPIYGVSSIPVRPTKAISPVFKWVTQHLLLALLLASIVVFGGCTTVLLLFARSEMPRIEAREAGRRVEIQTERDRINALEQEIKQALGQNDFAKAKLLLVGFQWKGTMPKGTRMINGTYIDDLDNEIAKEQQALADRKKEYETLMLDGLLRKDRK